MIALSLIAVLVSAAPVTPEVPLEPALEARVQALGKGLRCAVCQGLSISDSPSSMARAQLGKVRDLVAEGRTDAEVIEYFVARYGDWVLLDPVREGVNWLLWVLPIGFLAGALVALGVMFKGSAPATAQAAEAEAPAPQFATDPLLERIRAEVER